MIKIVCLDLINTIVSERDFISSRVDDVDLMLLKDMGILIDKKRLVRAKLNTLNRVRKLHVHERNKTGIFYKILLEEIGVKDIDNKKIDMLARRYEEIYLSNLDMDKEWISVLTKLKNDGKKIVIVSDGRESFIKKVCEKFNISKYIDFIFSCSDNGVEKSSGEPYRLIQKMFGAKNNEIVIVGDKIDADGAGAFANNSFFIKYEVDGLEKWEGEPIFFLARNPKEIIDAIKTLDSINDVDLSRIPIKVVNITYKELTMAVLKIYFSIMDRELNIDRIVGCYRKGIIPALLLALFMKKPFSILFKDMKIYPEPNNNELILFVDEDLHHGELLSKVKKNYKNSLFAVTFVHKDSVNKPDFFGFIVNYENEKLYYFYPWEFPGFYIFYDKLKTIKTIRDILKIIYGK